MDHALALLAGGFAIMLCVRRWLARSRRWQHDLRYSARLLLSPETAKAINTELKVNVLFCATDNEFQQLRAGLEIVVIDKQGLELRQ